jgi:hypothetical protein
MDIAPDSQGLKAVMHIVEKNSSPKFPGENKFYVVTNMVMRNKSTKHPIQHSLTEHTVKWVALCFIFRRSQVQILNQRPPILTEDFLCFPQPFQANSGIVAQIMSQSFLSM